jgi:hypothetical protein
MKVFYRFLQVAVIIALIVLVGFFVWGLSDGTVDADNMLLWLVLMGIPAGLLFASNQFWAKQQRGVACLLLAIPAAPAFFFGLFALMFIILQPDMR